MEGIQTFKGSWPWSWIRPYGIPSCITHRPLPIYQISFKSKKLFVDGRTYGRTDIFPPLILLGKLLEVDLKRCILPTTKCLNNNVPNLASCGIDKHELILIIVGKRHQYTFKNDEPIQLTLSLHFYLLYFLLNSSNGNDAILTSLSVPKLRCSARNTRFWSNICMCMNWKDIAPKPVDYRIWGLMQERVCKIADSCLQHQQL